MKRTLLPAVGLTALLLAPVAWAQPTPSGGLPGGPVLPAPDPDDDDDDKLRLTDVGLAVGRYIAGLVSEETEIYAGQWMTWRSGLKPGVELRFTTKRLSAAAEVPLTDGGPSRHRITYDDLIGGRVLVDVDVDARRLDDDRVRDERYGAGYRFGDGTIARFEVRGFQDDPGGASVRRSRFLLEPSFAAGGGEVFRDIEFRGRVRIGLERANVDGTGATRAIMDQSFGLRIGARDEMHLTVNVDTEVAYGVADGGFSPRNFQPSLGAANRVAIGLHEPGRWGVEAEWGVHREAFDIDLDTKDVLRRATYTARGYLALDDAGKYRLAPSITVEEVRNQLNPNLPTQDLRVRGALQADLNRFMIGAELGRDLDGVMRPMLRAGVRIPIR